MEKEKKQDKELSGILVSLSIKDSSRKEKEMVLELSKSCLIIEQQSMWVNLWKEQNMEMENNLNKMESIIMENGNKIKKMEEENLFLVNMKSMKALFYQD